MKKGQLNDRYSEDGQQVVHSKKAEQEKIQELWFEDKNFCENKGQD